MIIPMSSEAPKRIDWKRMDWKKNWLEIGIVVAILLSVLVSFLSVQGFGRIEDELFAIAGEELEIQEFIANYPDSETDLIKIAPKGFFGVKEGDLLDKYFENYEDDPLVGVIQGRELGSPFPNTYIVVYSPNPVQSKGYVVPHPPNPAAYVFFDEDGEVLFVEVLE